VIFERRQYTLRPGRVDDFWAAQRRWNVHEAAAALMDANLSAATDVLVRRGDRWLLRSRDVRVLTGAG
jgi:hypothetical protein